MGLFDGIANFFTGDQDNATYNAYRDLMGNIVNSAGTGMQGYLDNPTYTPAPLSDWTKQAAGAAQGLLGQGSAGSYADRIAQAGGPVSIGDIMGYAAPLSDIMTERGMNQLKDSYGTASTDNANDMAAQNAFAGSGSAGVLRQHMLDDSLVSGAKDLSLGADAAGLQYGAGLATGNADRQLAALSGADASRLAGLGYDLQVPGLLGGFGSQAQQYQQDVNNAPFTTATNLFGLLSGNVPDQQASGFQTLLGTILTGAKPISEAGQNFGWW